MGAAQGSTPGGEGRSPPLPCATPSLMPEPPAGPTPGPASDVAHRRRRRILAAAVPAAIALGLLVGYRPLLGAFARHAAASRGVDLDFDHIALGGSGLILTNARFGLAGVGG